MADCRGACACSRRLTASVVSFLFTGRQWQLQSTPLPRAIRKALNTLYKYRLKADYHGRKVTANEAREALTTALTVLIMVAEVFALSKRGLLQ